MERQCAAGIMSSGGHSSGVIDGRRQDAHRRRPRDVSLRLNETTSRAACGTAVQEEPPREKKTILYTTTHEKLVIERRRLSSDDENRKMRVLVNVSISDFGFDKIGDVLAISQENVPVQKSKKGEFIANETSLATLKWSGFHRTAADELYHSLWSNVNGTRNLRLPFPVTNIRFNDEMVQEAYKLCVPNASILECEAVGSDVDKCSNLLDEKEYEKFIDRELEEEENASYKSYP